MGAFSDFFTGVSNAAAPAAHNTGNQASTATQAGDAFFEILKTVSKSGSVKKAITDKLASNKSVQQFRAEETKATIRGYLTNPLVWAGVLVVVLIIGGLGYSWGKR